MRRIHFLLLVAATLIAGCSDRRTQYEKHLLADPPGQGTVTATWLSVAGILLDDGQNQILIDPFVSRKGMEFARIASGRRIQSDRAVVEEWADRLKLKTGTPIIVTHSHYDHSIDAPNFQDITKGPVYGSKSTLFLFSEERRNEWEPIGTRQTYQHGAFKIRFREGLHGKLLWFYRPFPDEIYATLTGAQPAKAFAMGQVYVVEIEHKGRTIVHLASAAVDPAKLEGLSADVVLLGVSGRPFNTRKYLADTVHRMCAEMVVPIHFDNIFKPFKDGFKFQSIAFFRSFMRAVEESEPRLIPATLPIGEPRTILPMPEGVRNDPQRVDCPGRSARKAFTSNG